jgi:hypothetical protein
MNTRIASILALLPILCAAGEPPASSQAARDEETLRRLVREVAAKRAPESPPRAATGKDALIAANLKSAPPARWRTERTDCDLGTCRVFDANGRHLYSYDAPGSRSAPQGDLKWLEGCRRRGDDMMSTFERQDRCSGIRTLPSPFDPPPFAGP